MEDNLSAGVVEHVGEAVSDGQCTILPQGTLELEENREALRAVRHQNREPVLSGAQLNFNKTGPAVGPSCETESAKRFFDGATVATSETENLSGSVESRHAQKADAMRDEKEADRQVEETETIFGAESHFMDDGGRMNRSGSSAPPAQLFINRIQNYLVSGGLFNPECMESDKVRTLLIDLRDHLLEES